MLRHCSKRLGFTLTRSKASLTLLQSRGLKEDTWIVGLAVDPDARNNLRSHINEVLSQVKIIPEEAQYRKQLELTMHHRLKAVNSQAADEEVEEQLEAQLESLIKQCKDELGLIPQMAEWKPWEVPAGHKVEFLVEEEVQPPAAPETPKTTGPLPPKK